MLDTENKFQARRYDEQMGGNSKNLLIVDTNSIIDGTKGVAYLVRSIKEQSKNAKILIVFDSIGAALNSSESDEDNEDIQLISHTVLADAKHVAAGPLSL